jgi:histidine triad (HIT) family protein
MNNCIFCKIIKGEIPSAKIYEDNEFLAFLDIRPLNKGHALVITKKHSETIMDISEEEICRMMAVIKKIMHAISSAIAPDGFNVFCNNKPAAGQEVPHIHFHVAPRFKNDGHTFKWSHGTYKEGEMEEIKKKIVKFL